MPHFDRQPARLRRRRSVRRPVPLGLPSAATAGATLTAAHRLLRFRTCWIFGAIRLGQQLPEVNVAVLAVLALPMIRVTVA